MNSELIFKKIENFDAKICVIGLGQVGLPTALTFSKAGYHVIGHDTNVKMIEKLNSKICPFQENGLEELLIHQIENEKFTTSIEIESAAEKSDIIIICVPTPLTEKILPDLSALENVCDKLSKIKLENKLIIIESSIPPGTFNGLVLSSLTKNYNKKEEFFSAFVPERLSPGQGLTEISSTPRLIGTQDEKSAKMTKKLYEKIVTSEILTSSVTITEISKLVENTFRDVNVAFANEVGMMCEKYNVDVKELIKVCNSHPRVNVLSPGPGVGGPCLPKDPYLLLNPQNGEKIESKLIMHSREINDFMPNHVVNLLESTLKKFRKQTKNSRVLILGTAYKGNVSDVRLSPAKEIISNLMEQNVSVDVFDPVTKEGFGGSIVNDIFEKDNLYDAIIILTDHQEFKKLSLDKIKNIVKDSPIILDTKRVFEKNEIESLGFEYVSIGYRKQT